MVRKIKISPYHKPGLLFPENSGHPTLEEKQAQPECSVWGALAFTLWVSRIVGIAPLSFKWRRKECRVRFSSSMSVYSYLLYFVLNAGCFVGIVMEFDEHTEKSMTNRYPSSNIIRFVVWFSMVIMANYGVLSAKKRMNCIISCLYEINKIRPKPNKDPAQISTERKRFIATVVCTIVLFFLSYVGVFLYIVLFKTIELNQMLMYVCNSTISFSAFLLETQFVCTALLVKSAVTSVNDALANLVRDVNFKERPELKDMIHVNQLFRNNLTVTNKFCSVPLSTKAVQRTMHRLFLSNGTICHVIGQLDKSFAFILLMLLSYYILRLGLAPYFLTVDILSNPEFQLFRSKSLLHQLVYFLFHTIMMVLIIEPGHLTLKGMKQTQKLVRKMLQIFSSPNDALYLELNQFMTHIEQNQVVYSPMGVCTLTRPFISTVFGAVTTYFVLILQFLAIDLDYQAKQNEK